MRMRKARRQALVFWARLSWAVNAAAPWCLGAGLLVSFTADAGQEVPTGASRAPLSAAAAVMPEKLAPEPRLYAASFGGHSGRGLLHEARLMIGAPEQLTGQSDEVEPRADLKRMAGIFPQIDRSHRGDPFVGLRPTLDGRWRQPGGVAQMRAEILAYGQDESGLASSFTPGGGDVPGPRSTSAFETWTDDESPPTQASRTPISPNQGATSVTARPEPLAERIEQGATPAIARAAALGSTTPESADQTPVEAFAATVSPTQSAQPLVGERRDYLAVIAPEKLESEKRCLAQAIYFEARSEPEAGQAAVAQVILNRMTSGLYPATICGVVFQNRSHRNACQFSFACGGKPLRVRDAEAWVEATRVADDVLDGKMWLADIGSATHYHADYVRPRWARALKKVDVIGKHIFYRLKSGET